jgi:hypothetical protein
VFSNRAYAILQGEMRNVEEFVRLFEGALSCRGPFLIEAVL